MESKTAIQHLFLHQEQLDNNHAVSAEDIDKLLAIALLYHCIYKDMGGLINAIEAEES